jgi:hypothetical protein
MTRLLLHSLILTHMLCDVMSVHTHTHTHTHTQTHIHTHTRARVLCLDVAQQSTVESTTQVSDARAAKEADEERLHARLSQLKQELWTVENKTVPEWVSTVDVATGDDVNPLPLHCTVQ